jgi:type IV pilus assembly protein PilE
MQIMAMTEPTPSLTNDSNRTPRSRAAHSAQARRPGGWRPAGFSLIELIVVVAIVAILAVIVLPSYRQYIVRANRSAAQSLMLELANREHQFFAANRRYGSEAEIGFTAMPGDLAGKYVNDPATPDDVIVLGGPPPSFTLTFVPAPGGIQAGDGTLTLDGAGNKGEDPDKWLR